MVPLKEPVVVPATVSNQSLRSEAPGCVSEPARSARDRRRFLDVEDAGSRRWRGLPAKVSGQCVAVGRRELVGPRAVPFERFTTCGICTVNLPRWVPFARGLDQH